MLILQQLPYIVNMANRCSQYHRDDVYSEGVLALVKAARTYDHKRGVKFFTYAKRRIDGQMKEYWRRNGKVTRGGKRREVKLPCDLFVNRQSNPDVYVEEKERRELLFDALGMLEPKHRLVVESIFFQGLTLEAVGCVMEYSKASVLAIRNKAIANLRSILIN